MIALGVTARVSSPEYVVIEVVERIRALEPQFTQIETLGEAEPPMTFRAPDLWTTERTAR